MHRRQVGTDGLDDSSADKPPPGNQRDTERDHCDGWHGRLRTNLAGAQHLQDCGERPDRVGDVVRPVTEGKTESEFVALSK